MIPNIIWKQTNTIVYINNENIQFAYKQCCIYQFSQNLILLAQHTQLLCVRADLVHIPAGSSVNPNIMWKHKLSIIYFYNENIQHTYALLYTPVGSEFNFSSSYYCVAVALLQLMLYVVAISIRRNPIIVWKYLILIILMDNNIIQHAFMQCCAYLLWNCLLLVVTHTHTHTHTHKALITVD